MKTLFIKSFILIMACYLFCAFLLFLNPKKILSVSEDYMGAMIDKHKRLDSIPAPRLLFVGGSNLAFGLNSKLIQEELHLPVVNMGLHGGLGLEFILSEIKPAIRKNDVVVLSIEYFLNQDGDVRLHEHVFDVFPPSRNFIHSSLFKKTKTDFSLFKENMLSDVEQVSQTIIYGFSKARPVVIPADSFVYRRNVFSSYGDVVGHFTKKGDRLWLGEKIPEISYKEELLLLNSFVEYADSQGARVYFSFPQLPESVFRQNYRTLVSFRDLITKNVPCKTLNTIDSFVLPDSCFFNSIYHLNKEGITIRTQKMIALLKTKIILF